MNPRLASVLVSLWPVVLISSSAAQERLQPGMGQGGRSPVLMLINQPSVQEELKLTKEQVSKAGEIVKAMREKAQDIAATDPKERMKKAVGLFTQAERDVLAILKPEQARRMHQIVLQQIHLSRAIERSEVVKELRLSTDQAKQIRAIRDAAAKEMAKLSEAAKSRDELRAKRAECTKASEEKMFQVLAAEQKKTWTVMLGEPFKGELKPGFGIREAPRPGSP